MYDEAAINFTGNARNLPEYKMFCSLYVTLSRCKLALGGGVSLLTPLSNKQLLAQSSHLLHQRAAASSNVGKQT